MSSKLQLTPPRQQQFVRFIETVDKIGIKTATGEVDQALQRMLITSGTKKVGPKEPPHGFGPDAGQTPNRR